MVESAKPKRRLPVIGSSSPDPEETERPRWQRIAIASATMLLAWIVLASLVNLGLGSRSKAEGPDFLVTGLHSLAFVTSAMAGGAITARLAKGRERRAGLVGANLTALLGWAVPFGWSLSTEGLRALPLWTVLLAAMLAIASAASALGHRLARQRPAG